MSRRLSLAIVAFAGLPGCQEPLSRCEQSVLPTCDAREADCQRALHEHVACVRGADPDSDPPEFEFVGQAEYSGRYNALIDPDPDTAACLRLAAFWPYDPTLESIEVTALFDTGRRKVVVADDQATQAILRAIVQAQRDVELDGFASWRAEHGLTSDQTSALDALFAGEAWMFGDAAALKKIARDDDDFRQFIDTSLDDYEDAELEFYSYARSWSFDHRYVDRHFHAIGARFALKTFLARDPAALEEAYARPVRSAAELIRGRLTTTLPATPAVEPALPLGYFKQTTDRLGAALYYSFLARVDPLEPAGPQPWDPQVDGDPQRFDAVAGRWAGDRFDCAIDESTGDALVVWDLAFDPTVELPLFSMTRNAPGTWRWVERENSLTLIGGDDLEAVEAVFASL